MNKNASGTVSMISDDQRLRVLGYQEDHFGDLKGIAIAPAKMSISASAFANADGGELWIGIDEDFATKIRTWKGFPRLEDANAHIQVMDGLFPLGGAYTYEFLRHLASHGFVLHVEVGKSRGIVLATNKNAYIRRNAQNLPVSNDAQMRQLERNKGITSYETETVKAPRSAVCNSATIINFMLRVVPTAEPEDWLRKQQILIGDLPTVAGIVLFADEPQAFLPKRSGIKIERYQSTGREGTRETMMGDPISIEGCAYDLIQKTVQTTQDIVSGIPRLGKHGFEDVIYPPVTIHEVITNAVLHGDYSIADDIHVRIFDNRVEIESPGTLPAHITEKNILKERFARNPNLVRLINKFPDAPNKDVGEGLNTAFAAMEKDRLRKPEIRQLDYSVLVDIRHERRSSPEDTVMEYLKTHEQITNTVGREITSLRSENTMKNVFGRLRDSALLERVPETRGGNSAWRRPTPAVAAPSPKPIELIEPKQLPLMESTDV